MAHDTLVGFGGEVKALGDGKVGGYLVVFSGPQDPDLTGDYFTKDTDFDTEDGALKSVYYAHGQDPQVGKRRIGRGSVKQDEVGVWIEAQLNLADQYEKAIYELAKKGKLGWSSGSASHLVERKDAEGGTKHITFWPLAEASLTPQPAESRAVATTSLKSLIEGFEDEPQTGSTFQDHSANALAAATDFATRAASLKALRASDNRSMSDKAKALCAETAAALEKVADELKQLVAEPVPLASAEDANRLYGQFQELLFETA